VLNLYGKYSISSYSCTGKPYIFTIIFMPYNLKRIKEYPLEELISQLYGYEFRRSGGGEIQMYTGNESHSCFVNTEMNTFKWFSKDVGGTIIDFIMEQEGVSVKGAIEVAVDALDEISVDRRLKPRVKRGESKKKKAPQRIEKSMIKGTVGKLGEKGRGYWNKRGIDNETLDYALVGQIYRYGKDYFTFPVYDFKLRPVFFKMRICPWSQGEKAASFPAGHGATMYGRQFVRGGDSELVIAEGESDVLACLMHDMPAISSTGGAGTWKNEWSKEINTWEQIKKVTVAYDLDEAGQKGQLKVMQSLAKYAPRLIVESYEWPEDYEGDLCELLSTL